MVAACRWEQRAKAISGHQNLMGSTVRRFTLTFAVMASVVAALTSSTAGAQPLRTGFLDEQALFSDPATGPATMKRIVGAGGTMVRFMIYWRDVAPKVRPAHFHPASPADPAYNWAKADAEIRYAAAVGLKPIVDLVRAPDWASVSGTSGARRPSARQYGLFAKAAARRYSGRFTPNNAARLPRVRYWQAWNEPNYTYFLRPEASAPAIYRKLVNAYAAHIHRVNPTNIVVAGGTGRIGALTFARNVLCLSSTKPYRSVCPNSVQFDAWGTNPYTSGGPTAKAGGGSVWLGDLPRLHSVLKAATRLHKVVNVKGQAKRNVGFWVTEFSWDSYMPDPDAVPAGLHARWTAEALYHMWRAGVSSAIWFTVRDRPLKTSLWQSGLYYCGKATTTDDAANGGMCGASMGSDEVKASLTAFKFPFVAHASKGAVSVWGRIPPGTRRSVRIERSTASGGPFVAVRTVRPGSAGIFRLKMASGWKSGYYRATTAAGSSRAFSLTRPSVSGKVTPFGCGGATRC
jgi:hypothetical protein